MEQLAWGFSPAQALVICPLVFLAGFVDAVAGGGGLVSLPAYFIAGLPVHSAIATNKISSAMGTALATARFARQDYLQARQAIPCCVAALLGSAGGASIALNVSEDAFKIIMLLLLPATAIYVMRDRSLGERKEALPAGKTLAISVAVAFGIGLYDGFYGPGTGTFLILLLTGLAHMGLREANGLTKAVNLTTNLAALAVFLANGKALIVLGLLAGMFSIAGNYVGTRFFDRKGAKAVRPLMVVVIALFFAKVLMEVMG